MQQIELYQFKTVRGERGYGNHILLLLLESFTGEEEGKSRSVPT